MNAQEKNEVATHIETYASESVKSHKVNGEKLNEIIDKYRLGHPKENYEYF